MEESTEEENIISPDVAGIVIKMTLKNFMCHEHLQVKFNRHINFICGKNGSGKSAILTGLVIGLGGKSSDTNRGSNLKGLIKCGKTQASIEITLMNEGPYAYKPEVFGNELTIIRAISGNSSSYKLCGSHGRPVQCKKNDLGHVLDQFKIQINNPICVLNQEMAKSFIKTSNPKELYKFFMRSTLMSELEDILHRSQTVTIPTLQKDIKDKRDELNFVNKDVEEIKQKHEKKKQLMELELEYERSTIEYNWSLVYKVQKELKKLKTRLTQIQDNINDLNKKIMDKDGSEKELIGKREKLAAELKELTKKKDEYTKHVLEIQSNYTNARTKYKDLVNDKKTLEKKLVNQKSDLEKIYERLKTLDSQNAEAAAKRDRIASRKEALKKRIHELKTIVNTNDNHKRNVVVSLQKKSEEVSTCESSMHQINSNILRIKQRIKDLQSNSSELTCFTDYMPRLVEEIELFNSKGKFERKPIGPLGHYIKLNDSAKVGEASFGPAVEAIIGKGLLCGFAVHSFRDAQVMKTIFQRLNVHNPPEMVISEFTEKAYDVRKHKVRHPQFKSMLDILDIRHPVVVNTIIDQREVEFILLLPTSEDAYSMMENVGSAPANCARAVTLDSIFYPAPNYRSYHLTNKKTTSMLQANKDSLIRNLQETINKLTHEEEETREAYRAVKDEETNIKRLVTEADREAARINKEMFAAEKELMTLDDEESFTSAEQEMLKDDVTFRKGHIEKDEKSLERVGAAIESVKEEFESAKSAKTNVDSEKHNYDEQIDSLQEELNQLEITYYEFTANFEKFQSKKKDQETIYEKVHSTILKHEEDLASKQEKAVNCGDQVDKDRCRQTDELKEHLSVVKNEIDVIKEFIGDGTLEEITEDLQLRLQKVEEVKNIVTETGQTLKTMAENTESRRARLETLRHVTSRNIKQNFAAITQLRKYKEDLIFDHQGRKLNIIVKTGAKNQHSSSVLSLSGGERSYSMVAFILALWQEMALPFYFLDEFDVFMDPLNRRIIINLLMMHARENRRQQFVFFTPNDFHIDMHNKDVGIFRMEDPRDDRLSQF